jgi:hypothetical protein
MILSVGFKAHACYGVRFSRKLNKATGNLIVAGVPRDLSVGINDYGYKN